MGIFFYQDLRVGDIVNISHGENQIRYKILNIDVAKYREDKFIHKNRVEIERGNLFSLLFENKSDLILQLDVPFQDRPKFSEKMFIELGRLD